MGKHEQIPEPASVPEESSKVKLRRFVLPAILGAAALVSGRERGEIDESSEKKSAHEPVLLDKQLDFSFSSIKNIVTVEHERLGERPIVQFDQWHEKDGSLELTMRELGGIDVVINSQKDLAQEMRYAVEHFKNRTFLVESVTKEAQEMFDTLKSDILMIRSAIDKRMIDGAKLLEYFEIRYGDWQVLNPSKRTFDRDRGQFGYFLLCRLNDIRKGAEEGKVVLNSEQAARLEQMRSTIETNPMVRGDMPYLWGGWYMLFAHGEIDVQYVDDAKAMADVWEAMRAFDDVDPSDTKKIAEIKREVIRLQNIREDKMLKIILEYAKMHPDLSALFVILGRGHFLKGNLMETGAPNALIKLRQRVTDGPAKELAEKGIFGIDLSDEKDRE